jgi:hypothetical protein
MSEKAACQRFLVDGSYTCSHSIDIASTDAAFNYLSTPTSVANPNIDRGNSDFDIRNSFTAGVTCALPSPGLDRLARAALGSWSADNFIFARTAPPARLIVSAIVLDALKKLKMAYPKTTARHRAELQSIRKQLAT